MKPHEVAVARARGYDLLARLVLFGPEGIPTDLLGTLFTGDANDEDLASEFVTAFDLGVPPYASTFLETDGRTGQNVTQHILDVLVADGLPPITDEVAACHLGVLLAHTGRLCAAGHGERAAAFVQLEVLSWLPAFVVAMESLTVPRWQAILGLTLDLVAEHGAREGPAAPIKRPVASPGHPLLDPDSGLRDVASFLGSAARCGFYLTDAECSQIGRALDLPRGFGHRRARIETLLRTAAEYESLVALCNALDDVAALRANRLRELADGRFDAQRLDGWLPKIEATRAMLGILRDGASGARQERTGAPMP